ncbi:MAG: aminopeptidase P family protein [Spirochaetaceae bacterium]|nr:aminopeptidase P family protein [Spirochaetaceae bacterium]
MFESEVYEARRRRLVEILHEKGLASGLVMLPANDEAPINYPDNCYPFRQDSNWLYFVGLDSPGMLAFIDLGDGSTTLYADGITMDDMIWTGSCPGVGEMASMAGIGSFNPLERAQARVEMALRRKEPTFCLPFYRAETKGSLARHTGLSARQLEKSVSTLLVDAVIGMREIKEEREIAEMERATALTASMHQALLDQLRPGWTGHEAKALVQSVAEKSGLRLSFATIATIHGETLHNHSYDYVCREGDMLLLDAGAEAASGYAGDLTTTFPVSARFTQRQAQAYDILSKVFSDATKALAPGRKFLDVHLQACRSLVQGLKEIGIMRGDPGEAVAAGAHALFFPHGLGHMIGLDVHDMEGLGEDRVGYGPGMARSPRFGLASLRLAKELKPGMVHSIEPGIYFIPALIEKWENERCLSEFIDYNELEKWKDLGGIRIEEDWLVTADSARRLGPEFDKSRSAIERRRSGE